jgi:hypothetical protein
MEHRAWPLMSDCEPRVERPAEGLQDSEVAGDAAIGGKDEQFTASTAGGVETIPDGDAGPMCVFGRLTQRPTAYGSRRPAVLTCRLHLTHSICEYPTKHLAGRLSLCNHTHSLPLLLAADRVVVASHCLLAWPCSALAWADPFLHPFSWCILCFRDITHKCADLHHDPAWRQRASFAISGCMSLDLAPQPSSHIRHLWNPCQQSPRVEPYHWFLDLCTG